VVRRDAFRNLPMRSFQHGTSPLGPPRRQPEAETGRAPQRSSRGRLLWLLLISAVVVGLAALYREHLAAPTGTISPAGVRKAQVWSGTLEQSLRLTGTTEAEDSLQLRAPYLQGRRSRGRGGAFSLVLQELIAPGARVKEGDVVAEFDPVGMLIRLDDERSARANLESALKKLFADIEVVRTAHGLSVQKAKGEMDKATLDLKTQPALSAIQGEILELNFDEAQMNYKALLADKPYVDESQEARIRLARLELREAGTEERRAQANAERMVVRAPIDGLVVIREIRRGGDVSQIEAGDQLHRGQVFMQIVDPSSMIVEAEVNQADVRRLRIGADAQVGFDAFPDLELPASVYSIGTNAQSGGWRGTYVRGVPVVLKLERSDPRVIPSLSASADIVLQREESTEIVPREAIFYDEGDGQPFAYVETPSGWERRELELGLANNVAVAVLSGLSEGETVAVERPLSTG